MLPFGFPWHAPGRGCPWVEVRQSSWKSSNGFSRGIAARFWSSGMGGGTISSRRVGSPRARSSLWNDRRARLPRTLEADAECEGDGEEEQHVGDGKQSLKTLQRNDFCCRRAILGEPAEGIGAAIPGHTNQGGPRGIRSGTRRLLEA